MRRRTKIRMWHLSAWVALAAGVIAVLGLWAPEARAFCPCVTCTDCGTVQNEHDQTEDLIDDEHDYLQDWIEQEFDITVPWLVHLFDDYLQPAWRALSEQMTTVAMDQAAAIGAMLDAEQQLKAQRLFDDLETRTHKDYQPSVGVCVFGTNVRSLASAERNASLTRFVLSQWSQDRGMGHANTSAAEGEMIDRNDRLEQFKERYCDRQENNELLEDLCPNGSGPANTVGRDINYHRTIDYPMTMDLDFADNTGGPTDDEEDVLALASNLYAHRVFLRIPEAMFHVEQNKKTILDARSVIAKRSVAEASFQSIVGMKAQGSPVAAPIGSVPSYPGVEYMTVLLKELGLNDDEVEFYLGERPSYYAQMDVLTKRLYQNQSFYVGLYDTPVNVRRKRVALQAIKLMQDFDTLESYLRTEMMLSLILEIEVVKLQVDVQNRLHALTSEGEKI